MWVRVSGRTSGAALTLALLVACSPETVGQAGSKAPVQSAGSSALAAGFAGVAGTVSVGGAGAAAVGGTAGLPLPPPAAGATPPAPPRAGSAGLAGAPLPAGAPAPAGSGGMPVAGSGPVPSGNMPTNLPMPKEACQDFKTGTMKFLGLNVQIWAGKPAAAAPGGPLLIYWHGTGTSSSEASSAFGQGIGAATAEGGIVASFIDTTMKGSVSGGTIWYNEDLPVVDQIVACAIEKQKIDVRRIYSSGYSAGGLQTGAMLAQRSNYVAAGLIYSGGVIAATPNPDPTNIPALMCAHGAVGSDSLGLDFAMGCENLETQTVSKGGFAVDCNDGGAHIDILTRFSVADFGYKFLMAHPFKTKPSPWATMLPGAPATCKIWQKN
jgi:hypothetical protein